MVNLTEKAAAEIKAIMEQNGGTYQGVRVFVAGGGCSGLSYGMEICDEPATAEDQILGSRSTIRTPSRAAGAEARSRRPRGARSLLRAEGVDAVAEGAAATSRPRSGRRSVRRPFPGAPDFSFQEGALAWHLNS